MIEKHNRTSLRWGIPGIILGNGGPMISMIWESEALVWLGSVCALGGMAMLFVGFVYYLKAKQQHPAWALTAFLSLIGIICMALLKDRHLQSQQRMAKGLCPMCEYDRRGVFSSPCPECGAQIMPQSESS